MGKQTFKRNISALKSNGYKSTFGGFGAFGKTSNKFWKRPNRIKSIPFKIKSNTNRCFFLKGRGYVTVSNHAIQRKSERKFTHKHITQIMSKGLEKPSLQDKSLSTFEYFDKIIIFNNANTNIVTVMHKYIDFKRITRNRGRRTINYKDLNEGRFVLYTDNTPHM